MIKNNKGFMLAEVVIVSAVLITTLVSLYAGFAKVYKAYEERSSFFDTDSIYALKSIEDTLIDEGLFNNIINEINTSNYVSYLAENLTDDSYINSYLKELLGNYNIEYFYIAKYDNISFNAIKESNVNNFAFNDFLTYLQSNLSIGIDYNYIFLSKTKDGRFAYLRVL